MAGRSMSEAIYEIRKQEAIRAKEIEERALKGERITYNEYLATWSHGKLQNNWYEDCGFLGSHKRLKADILFKLTGIQRGTFGSGAR